jgi:hypothetical protein
VYILLQAWALYNFSKGEIPVIWPLRLLRAVANVSASIAFIPLFNMLVRPLACGSEYDSVVSVATDQAAMPCSLRHALFRRVGSKITTLASRVVT